MLKAFNDHLAIHFKEKRFKCEYCEWIGRRKGDLMEHIKAQHDDSRFRCTLCSAIFGSEKLHQRHMSKIHKMPNESELYRIKIEADITEEDMKEAFPNRK